MSGKLPSYVEYGSLATAPAPLRCTNTRLDMFLLRGELGALAELCDRVLTVPIERRVVALPLGNRVLVSFGQIGSITAKGGDYARRGHVSERQIATWVPVLLLTHERPRIGMFVVNMWLDNPISVASGREQFGYPKSWGWGTFPKENDRRRGTPRPNSDDYELEVPALAPHRSDTPLSNRPLLALRPRRGSAGASLPAPSKPAEDWEWSDVSGTVFDMLVAKASDPGESGQAPEDRPVLLPDGDLQLPPLPEGVGPAAPAEELDGLSIRDGVIRIAKRFFERALDFAPPVNQTFLRQFRAPHDGTLASESNVVMAPATVEKDDVHSVHVIGPQEAEVYPLDSHPLGRDLGLSGRQELIGGLSVRFDFAVDNGEVLG